MQNFQGNEQTTVERGIIGHTKERLPYERKQQLKKTERGGNTKTEV
jgi:hypothetical protein